MVFYDDLMIARTQQLPNDINALKEIISNLSKLTDKYEKEIKYLEEKNNLLLQILFGRRSEKITRKIFFRGDSLMNLSFVLFRMMMKQKKYLNP